MLYLVFVRLSGWIVLLTRSSAMEDAGLLAPRQEVAVLRQQHPKPRLDWTDRVTFAALTRLVTPGTVGRSSRLATADRAAASHRHRRVGLPGRLATARWARPVARQRHRSLPRSAGVAKAVRSAG